MSSAEGLNAANKEFSAWASKETLVPAYLAPDLQFIADYFTTLFANGVIPAVETALGRFLREKWQEDDLMAGVKQMMLEVLNWEAGPMKLHNECVSVCYVMACFLDWAYRNDPRIMDPAEAVRRCFLPDLVKSKMWLLFQRLELEESLTSLLAKYPSLKMLHEANNKLLDEEDSFKREYGRQPKQKKSFLNMSEDELGNSLYRISAVNQ